MGDDNDDEDDHRFFDNDKDKQAIMKFGFVGIGIMGAGMANRLVGGGLDVTVWNRTASKAQFLVDQGAKLAASAKEVVEKCDITFACVSDPKAAENLVFCKDGVLEGVSKGKG